MTADRDLDRLSSLVPFRRKTESGSSTTRRIHDSTRYDDKHSRHNDLPKRHLLLRVIVRLSAAALPSDSHPEIRSMPNPTVTKQHRDDLRVVFHMKNSDVTSTG